MTRAALTPLQRGVIERLRQARFHGLAAMAIEHWTVGRSIPGLRSVAETAASRNVRYVELLEDFGRANEEATMVADG